MDYKLIAIDLDDTLLDVEQGLSDEAITVLRKLESQGIKVIIATGRMLISALPYIKQLGLSGPMITYNGAYVKNISTDSLLYHQSINKNLARKIIKYAVANDLHINLYQDDQLYIAERNEEAVYYEKTSGVTARIVGPLAEFIEKDVTKLLIVEFDWDKKIQHMKQLQAIYQSALTITESKKPYIEFMARGVSKGKALEKIANNLGINQNEVIAIGDSWNDLEMILWAGLGIMVDTAPIKLKEQADLVAPSVEEGGVPAILKQIFSGILDKS